MGLLGRAQLGEAVRFLERIQKWAPFVSQGTRFRAFGLGSRAKLLGFAILTVTLAAPRTTIARSTSKA